MRLRVHSCREVFSLSPSVDVCDSCVCADLAGAHSQTRDFLLDNSGLLIYKVLPFAIAALHLPYFRDVTEGMKVFE